MSHVLPIGTADRPRRAPQTASLKANLVSYGASGLLFTAFLMAALGIFVLASLARIA